jgi:hypothetical protein
MESGWEDWDVEVMAGPVGSARVVVTSENHGADKRLLRVRAALRLSACARIAIGGFAGLSVLSLVCGWSPAAAVSAIAAGVCAGFAGWQLARFARRLHGLVEAAAHDNALIPVEPLAPRSAPLGPPRAA